MKPLISRLAQDASREAPAAIGEPVWGPAAWLADLELRLGLPPVEVSEVNRLRAYAKRLEACLPAAPFYAQSFERDRYGTAATLLEWRDALVEAGWCGQPVPQAGPRVAALVAAEAAEAEPLQLGFADRVARVELELGDVTGQLYDTIRLLEPSELWPEAWRRVMDLLRYAGTRFEIVDPKPRLPTRDTDLSRTQRVLALPGHKDDVCRWRGDGSLVFLRARTSWELGEALVGYLRSHPQKDVLIVRLGDPAPLESALQLQGLATQGNLSSSPLRSPLQILPLALSLVFAPRDPYRALELLTLPENPLGAYASSKLAEAIGQSPGIGSRAWQQAKERLSQPLDPANPAHVLSAQKAAHKIEAWLEGPAFDRLTGAPTADVLAVIERVKTWAAQRPHDATTTWLELANAAADLAHLVAAHPAQTMLPHELDRLAARVLQRGMSHTSTPEAAGRWAHVSTPSGVLRSHELIVVWHAGYDPNAAHRSSPWRAKELRALEEAGIRFSDPKELTQLESASFRRALSFASDTFVVATADAHLSAPQPALPLWDEMVARSGAKAEHVAAVSQDTSEFLRRRRAGTIKVPGAESPGADAGVVLSLPRLELPAAHARWQVDASLMRSALALVTRFYPTALENLLACPLRWVLESVLRIRPGRLTSVPDKALLYGSLGHRLAEELHRHNVLGAPAEVRALVEPLLDELIQCEGGPLLMPGMTAEREQVRANLVRAMHSLSELIADSGLSVKGVETETIAAWAGRELGGRMDLLLVAEGGDEAIVDLKWGESRYRDALAKGLALQLASYAATRRLETGADQPLEAAYFALKSARGLSLRGSRFKHARGFDGDSLEETWARAERTTELVLATLAQGDIPTSANAGSREYVLAHHQLPVSNAEQHFNQRADAACGYCASSALCGRAFRAG